MLISFCMVADKLPKFVVFWGLYPSLIGLIFRLAMFGHFIVKKNYLLAEITASRALHSYCNVVQVSTPAIQYKFENLNQLLISVKGVIYCTVHHSIFTALNSIDITQINRKSFSHLQQMWKLLHRLLHVTSCFIKLHNLLHIKHNNEVCVFFGFWYSLWYETYFQLWNFMESVLTKNDWKKWKTS